MSTLIATITPAPIQIYLEDLDEDEQKAYFDATDEQKREFLKEEYYHSLMNFGEITIDLYE